MIRVIVLLFFGALLSACGNSSDTGTLALSAVKDGAVLIDVRTAEEFASGHLSGAINIPHGEIIEGIAELDVSQSTDIVLYCRSGNRSGIATTSLSEAGFSKAMNAGAYSTLKPLWDAGN
ncbi:MAG: phage shock protein E [Glaciecola sp.]|jgi:phage shock protein E|uniref:rhodanese-like domain-containing protein n=1 Tax=Congregibacter sp. TaxID=2744308 RepID=UPI0039E3E72D